MLFDTTDEDCSNWLPDDVTTNCMLCGMQFSLFWRRHHCRVCGKIFCAQCCPRCSPPLSRKCLECYALEESLITSRLGQTQNLPKRTFQMVEYYHVFNQAEVKKYYFGIKECMICLSELNDSDNQSQQLVILSCTCIFHYPCITKWWKSMGNDKIDRPLKICPLHGDSDFAH